MKLDCVHLTQSIAPEMTRSVVQKFGKAIFMQAIGPIATQRPKEMTRSVVNEVRRCKSYFRHKCREVSCE